MDAMATSRTSLSNDTNEGSPLGQPDGQCFKPAGSTGNLMAKRCLKLIHEHELNTFLDLLQDGKVDQSDDHEVIPKHLRLTSHQNLRRFQLKYEGPLIVQCANPNCQRFAEIPRNGDPSIIPDHWFCSMTIPRCWKALEWQPTPKEYVKVDYVPGSLVWAKVACHPLWPGMVDFCPDTREYYWNDDEDAKEPTHYNVVFFVPKVARTWVAKTHMKPFNSHEMKTPAKPKTHKETFKAYEYNLQLMDMSLRDRLLHYSFLNLFKGKWSDFETEQRKKLQLTKLKRKRPESAIPSSGKKKSAKLEQIKRWSKNEWVGTIEDKPKKREVSKDRDESSVTHKAQRHETSSSEEDIPLDSDTDVSVCENPAKADLAPPIVLDEISGHLIDPQGGTSQNEEAIAPLSPETIDLPEMTNTLEMTNIPETTDMHETLQFQEIMVQVETNENDRPSKGTSHPEVAKLIDDPQPSNMEDLIALNDAKKIRRKIDPRAVKSKGIPILNVRMGDFKGQSMVWQNQGMNAVVTAHLPAPIDGVSGRMMISQRPMKPLVTIEGNTIGKSQHVYNRPPLPARFLAILAVQNTVHPVALKTDFSSVVEFLMTHFPYFELRPELARSVLELVLGANQDKVFAIAPQSVSENEPALRREVEQNQSKLRDSMRYPCLLEAFLSNCSYPSRHFVAGPVNDEGLMMLVFWSLHSQVHGFVDHRQSKHEMDLMFRFMFPFFSGGSTNYVLPILLEGFKPNRSSLKCALLTLSEMTESDIAVFSPCQKYLKHMAQSFKRSLENGLLT
ncbi:hypothetical protein TCAL_16596 [Tigriopus californicus]|uniref:PWWP domain-containing protein n=1 Tax=Tigriopus californicus TaxID=6832 RepID=A0A553NBB9_TIGCA|nr:uncharacterized protein LOC131888452 [Tigriopus californicus]TRY62733.1 hypothetical protein TCAL_16596 [Tigriopus californicus]